MNLIVLLNHRYGSQSTSTNINAILFELIPI